MPYGRLLKPRDVEVSPGPSDANGVFKVRVEGERFAAGHMATFGNTCERLHGHSYEVAAEVEGELTGDSWVVDFIALKAILRRLCQELDHRFILQRESRVLQIEETEAAWRIETPQGAAYLLPRSDVIAMPIDNSTAERLAEWLSNQVRRELAQRGANNLHSLTIEVNEGPDQKASHRGNRLPQE